MDNNNNNNNRRFNVTAFEILLRAMAFCVTLLATLLTSVDKETYTFVVNVSCWILKILNGTVCLYLQGSLILSVIYYIKKRRTEFPIFLPFDLLMTSMMLSSATATAIVAALKAWENIFTIGYPILLTYLGSFLFIWLTYVATIKINIRMRMRLDI